MQVPVRYARCKRIFCNLWQTKEERCAKYALARQLNFNSYAAMRMRDWRTEEIIKAAQYYEGAQKVFKDHQEKETDSHEV